MNIKEKAKGLGIKTKDDALQLIVDIAIDYDSYRKAEDLMLLIDELSDIAKIGLLLDDRIK